MKKIIIKKINFTSVMHVKKFLDKHKTVLDNIFVNHLGGSYLVYQSDRDNEHLASNVDLKIYHIKDNCFYKTREILAKPEKISQLVPNRLLIETLKKIVTQSSYSISVSCPILEAEMNIPLINIRSGYSYGNNYETMDNIFSNKKDPLSAISIKDGDYRLNEALLQLILVQHTNSEEIQQRMKDSLRCFSENEKFLSLVERSKINNAETILKVLLLFTPAFLIYYITQELLPLIDSKKFRLGILFSIVAPYFYFLITFPFSSLIPNNQNPYPHQEKLNNLKACIREQNCLFVLLATMKNLYEEKVTATHLHTNSMFKSTRERKLPSGREQPSTHLAFNSS